MDNDVAITVEHASKKFCRYLARSMWYGVQDIGRNLLGRGTKPDRLRKDEFWAVDDVSFEVHRGETLGIIGPNGSGKSTILKMLNGIFMPDKGKIEMKGKVGALIEIGAGFHPMLTGGENIYVNGAILGMNKKEMDDKFDDIVEFADIGDFLDTPVKNYSSGMLVRLGFAVAVHCEPDILLVDEVLAVGDVGFRAKCYNRIAELQKKCTVVFVSHDMRSISRISSKCMVLNNSRSIFQGDVEKAIQKYFSLFDSQATTIQSSGIRLVDLIIDAHCEDGSYLLNSSDSLSISIGIESDIDVRHSTVILQFHASSDEVVAEWNSRLNGNEINIQKGLQHFQIFIPSLKLNVGPYDMTLIITSENRIEHLLWVRRGWKLKILGNPIGAGFYQVGGSIKKSYIGDNLKKAGE